MALLGLNTFLWNTLVEGTRKLSKNFIVEVLPAIDPQTDFDLDWGVTAGTLQVDVLLDTILFLEEF